MESEISPQEARQALDLADAAQQEISRRNTVPWWARVLLVLAFDAMVMSRALASEDAAFAVVLGASAVFAGVALCVRLRNGLWPRQPEQGRAWTVACAVFSVALMFAVDLLRSSWPAAPIVLGLVAGPVLLMLAAGHDRAARPAESERS